MCVCVWVCVRVLGGGGGGGGVISSWIYTTPDPHRITLGRLTELYSIPGRYVAGQNM